MKLITLLSVLSLNAMSQTAVITGKVVDGKTKEPLAFANVFIDRSTIGTSSDQFGKFILKNVMPGSISIIVSFVGYHLDKTTLIVESGINTIPQIELAADTKELSEIKVQVDRDKVWDRQYKRFEKIFLGNDQLASDCRILNPWVLEFSNKVKGRQLVATANEALEIENRSLGYKLFFYLSEFWKNSQGYLISGNVQFEELPSLSPEMDSLWSQNREKAYVGSVRHFFKSIVSQQLTGQNFKLYTERPAFKKIKKRSPFFLEDLEANLMEYDTTEFFAEGNAEDTYEVRIKGRIEVHNYNERSVPRIYRDMGYEVSWIQVKNDTILVNRDGLPMNPVLVIASGAFSDQRVSQTLPVDYKSEVANWKQENSTHNEIVEQIYVQTDKPYYYAGDPLWFKGYIRYSNPIVRDSLSRTVYVELLTSKNVPIQSMMLRIEEGVFHGNIVIPDSLSAGSYFLRAYTNFNRNFGDSTLYLKAIPVIELNETVTSNPFENQNYECEQLVVKLDREQYMPREQIEVTLQNNDEEEIGVESNLSISVTDMGQVANTNLSPSIIDEFQQPFPYSTGRIDYTFPLEYGINYKGIYYSGGEPKSALLNVVNLDSREVFVSSSNDGGEFQLRDLVFYDSANFLIQPIGGANSNPDVIVEIVPRTIPTLTELPKATLNILEKSTPQRYISEYEIPRDARMLEEIVIQSSRPIEDTRPSSYGRHDFVVEAKDLDLSTGNLLLTLPGKLPGLVVRQSVNSGEAPRWVVYTTRSASLAQGREVLVTLNDVPVAGVNPADFIATINPATIKAIALTTRLNPLYGSQGAFGVLAIYTKDDVENLQKETRKAIKFTALKGYSSAKKFRAPYYEAPQTSSSSPDFRATLYWNPMVVTNSKSETTISFFASDLPGKYRVLIEGIANDGEPLRCEKIVEVVKP